MITEHNAITEPVRRVEVFTGAGRRRSWTAEEKARIVAESATGDESVCAVARRHGLSPQQLFGWRRQARHAGDATPMFVPAVVEVSTPERTRLPGLSANHRRTSKAESGVGVVEIEIGGSIVRVSRGVDADTLTAVITALKATT